MTEQTTAPAATTKDLRQVATASISGMALESYDFLLYGSAAALVFNRLFFPTEDPLVGTLLAFVSYALGFFVRPLGGLVFGHFGDRIGRKPLLIISILLMGGATFAIGLLPTFAAIGVWAAIVLSLLRMVQGFALGGEWGGAMLLIAERVPGSRRGWWTGLAEAGIPLGNLLATGVLFVLSTAMDEEAFLAWGWRIPFLLSAVLMIVGYWIRRRVSEAPLFEQSRAEVATRTAKGVSPIRSVFRSYKKPLAVAASARLTENISYYVIVSFVIAYVVQHDGYEQGLVLGALVFGNVAQMVATPLFGRLSDRIGRRPVILIGAIGMGVWIFAFFPLIDTGSAGLVALAIVVGLIFHSALYGPQAAYFAEQFDTPVRYTGMSMAAQLTTIIGGAVAPLIATALLAAFGSALPVSVYVLVAAVLTVIGTVVARETNRRDLAVDERAAV